jgi:HlyD family secretion protein
MSQGLRKTFYRVKRLKLWQAMLLIAVAIGVVSGVSIGCGGSSEGSTTGANGGNTTQLVTVQYGNLTSSISASGSLVYSTSRQLTFDSAGTVAAVYVEKDDTVKKGDVLARLDSESIESLEGAVARARINLRDAEEALEDAQNPYSESDIADARLAVEYAQQQLTDAQQRSQIKIANAEYAVDKALNKKNDSLVQYMSGKISADEYQQAVRDWEIAVLDLEMAKVSVAQTVSAAENNLEKAEETLQEALAGADSLQVALKQSELDSAKATLDKALEQLESAKEGYPVVAPFDGVVADVNVKPGDEVNANTVIIELIDPSAFEMSAIVDEIDVAQLRLGQKATVTLDAFADLELSGNVSSISAFAQSQSGVVSYPISVSLSTPQDVRLLEGMSATATIEIKLATNALLIPKQAIVGTSSRAVVMVMVDGQQQPRMVTLGATDGVRTEAVSGLKEGDVVIVNAATSGTSSGGFPIVTPPGGFPPGGFPPGDFPPGDFPPDGFPGGGFIPLQ